MTRPTLWIPPGGNTLVEITNRTLQGRFLLEPSPETNGLILGVLGRAQRIYRMKICAMVFMSHHYHLLVIPKDARQLSRFMNFVGGELGRKVSRETGWNSKVWAGRYRPIVVASDADSQTARLRYILGHGVKERLVERPGDWRGVNCVDALLKGRPLVGRWPERTREYEARRRGTTLPPDRLVTEEEVVLSPLPCWQARGLDPNGIRQEARNLVRQIESWARAERALSEGSKATSAEAVFRSESYPRPVHSKTSPCRLFHASSKPALHQLREGFRQFSSAYGEASRALRSGALGVRFPPGCFPPAGPFVPVLELRS